MKIWKQLIIGSLIAIAAWTAIGALGASASNSAAGLTLVDGRKTVSAAGAPEALASAQVVFAVTITALEGNAGTVVVGGSTCVGALATRRGRPLAPGESMSIAGNAQMAGFYIDLATIYVDAVTSGDGVSYVAMTR